MNDLGIRLERLGLSQYLQSFVSEGFDSWDTILDITESDLNVLNVKLGHRRKLQRAIAESRGTYPERSLLHERKPSLVDGGYQSDDSEGGVKESSGGRGTPIAPIQGGSSTGTKRKYRRHPKSLKQADENAPERPPSAYVIFSNMVREELRGQDLSFTEIAKLVGERWQVLASDLRESCERQAAGAKEKYYAEMADYKKTPQYAQYQEYLADFKAKHATPRYDGKRSRVEPETSTEPTSAQSSGRDKFGDKPVPPSVGEGSSLRILRSHSNSRSGTGFSALGGYHATSASTSPATYSVGLQSPASQPAHSPGSSPPASASVYSHYDLPHHARGTHSPADIRPRESAAAGYGPSSANSRYWPGQGDEAGAHSPLQSDLLSRRPARPSPSIPSLVRNDTTHSSYSDGLPGVPYQGSLLPGLDATKADRMLPAPIPSTGSIMTSPLDARPPLPGSGNPVPQLQSHERGSQWPALLRATELARDADLQDASAKREESTP